jgi:hypothetical protein
MYSFLTPVPSAKRCLATLALCVVAASAAPALAQQLQPVDLSAVANYRYGLFDYGASTFPSGAAPVMLDGVPYRLPATGNHMWHSIDGLFGGAQGTRSVTIPVGVAGVDAVYTLMGTYWGETGPSTMASISFFGSGGAVYTMALDGGAEIRDYNFNPNYTTAINSAVTKEIWSNGTGPDSQHIDRQRFQLPAAFLTQTLDSIVLTDSGRNNVPNLDSQRTFISAVTVSVVPEPGMVALWLAGLPLLVAFARRRRG